MTGVWYNAGMGNRRLVAFNTISQVTGKIITSATTFGISIIIARTLGATGYGDFTKITTLVAFFYLFSDFGLNAAYLEHSDKPGAAGVLLSIRLAISLLCVFLLLSLLNFLPGDALSGYSPMVKLGIILYAATILFQGLITTANAFFQQHLRYDLATYALALGSIITLCMVAGVSVTGMGGILPYIIALTAGTFTTMTAALFFSGRYIFPITISLGGTLGKSLLHSALPLGLTLLCNVVYFHADSVILTISRSTADVGMYGFAYKLFEFPLVIPTFVMNAVFPLLLTSLKQGDTPAFARQIRQSLLFLVSIASVAVVVGFLCAPLLALIKADFQGSVAPLRVLLLGLPVFYCTGVTMWMMVALKKRRALLAVYALSMLTNVTLNILLVPIYGYMAAAWITVGSEALVLALSLIILRKTLV